MIAKVVVPSYFFYTQYSIHELWQHGKCYCHWQIG